MEINNPFERNTQQTSLVFFSKAGLSVYFLALILITLSLAGCVTLTDFDSTQEYSSDVVSTLDPSTSLGQTFISRRPHLNGITVWISVPDTQSDHQDTSGSNPITVKLFHSPEDSASVFSTTILAPTSGNNIPVNISIPHQDNPPEQNFYLLLTKTAGSVQVNGRNEDAYPHGQAYISDRAVNADIAFRLSYDYDLAAFAQDVTQNLASLWLAFPLLAVVWLPGWLLIEFCGLRRQLDFGEQTGLAVGISLALVPLVMLWTTILHLRWTRSGVLIVAGILTALFCGRVINSLLIPKLKPSHQENSQSAGQIPEVQPTKKPILWASLTLLLIFFFTLIIRLIMVRDLATPAWVDSVHHALITRLILSAGSYPSSYLPYWDFVPTAYHPGFHGIAAAFTWLSTLTLDRSLLILGQVLNALMVFPVYLLAKSLTKQVSIGLIAAVMIGFLTPMPAYYTSWGRYTELAGLLILPAAFVLVKLFIESPHSGAKYWLILLSGITTGGLFMVHYRVVLFLGCLIFLCMVVYSLGNKTAPFNRPVRELSSVLILALAGILLVSPWMFQTVKNTILPLISTSGSGSIPLFQDFSWAYLTAAMGKQTLVLAGLGLIWGMVRRERFAYLLLSWVMLLFFIANLVALSLPGGNLVNNTSVEIMLFIPISILGGYVIDQIISSWRSLPSKLVTIPVTGIIFVILSLAAYLGSRQLVSIINPVTVLSRQADLPAMDWINLKIPTNETIVINSFNWGYGLYAGNDGGYWISPLTGRLTIPPPVLYGMDNEMSKINGLVQQVVETSSDPKKFHDLLIAHQLRYIYIGARGGIISPQKLSGSGLFEQLYQQDGTWIFRVKP
jgi:hypothetical protein